MRCAKKNGLPVRCDGWRAALFPARACRLLLLGCSLLLVGAGTPPVARAGGSHTVTLAEVSGVLTLDDCLRLARERNPDILAAARQLDVARAGITTAKAGIYPTLGASGTYLKREANFAIGLSNDVNRRSEDYSVSARLTQNIFSSGRVRAQIDIAKKGLTVQSLTYQTAVETTLQSVRITFYQTLLAEATVPVRQQAIDLLGQQVRDEEGRFAAGTVSQVNVSRARVSLSNEEPAVFQARDDLRTSYISLAQLLGVDLKPGELRPAFRIRGSLASRPGHPDLAECLHRAEAQRPEVLARKIELESAQRQITVEKAGTRPRVDVFASYDVFSEPSTISKNDNYNGYTIGVQGTWQVFDGGATLGRVRAQRARVLAIGDQLRQARLTAQSEVRVAFESLLQAERTLASQGGNSQAAEETLRLLTTNVGAGLSTQLDLLQGRLDLTRAQTTRLNALFAYHSAQARLLRAMGEAAPVSEVEICREITTALDPRGQTKVSTK